VVGRFVGDGSCDARLGSVMGGRPAAEAFDRAAMDSAAASDSGDAETVDTV
jgi:hypothetical protein